MCVAAGPPEMRKVTDSLSWGASTAAREGASSSCSEVSGLSPSRAAGGPSAEARPVHVSGPARKQRASWQTKEPARWERAG